MKRSLAAVFLLVCVSLIPSLASAAPIKAYVAEFAVTPTDNGSLKKTLQTLLASRIASESVLPVASTQEAEVVVQGNYTQLGKVFSLDVVAKQGERTLTTVFEQGESQDELIPALSRIAGKLKTGIAQNFQAAKAPAAVQAPAPVVQAPLGAGAQQQQGEPGIIGSTLWVSQRLPNAQEGIAIASEGPQGREYFVAEAHALRLYRQEKTLKLLAEVQLTKRGKVIAIDTLGPDQAGKPRVFVTIIDGEAPSSQIFSYQDGKLKLVAEKLPYMFRAIALDGGPLKMYAQEMSLTDDFYGDLYEIAEHDGKIEKVKAIKLPRWANIYNYNSVPGPDGKSYPVVTSPDGYLIIYSDAGEELWRSSERFGGSETYFQREDDVSIKRTFEKMRWRFLDQRVYTTKEGDVIVPQNAGFFVIGNSRSYSKYSVFGFNWTGSSLEERWRTKQSQNYLADFVFKPATHELVLLEVVQKEGVFSKGGSAVRVMKLD
ncbi:hypothetical protein [Geomonas silvestris]|uniref:hypothetical protein n=1 Tax=Geomonas silvestris TaxID=2740184 RepID=UPI00161AEAA0|nr:hypothetical protein [Geomonas silvestris]